MQTKPLIAANISTAKTMCAWVLSRRITQSWYSHRNGRLGRHAPLDVVNLPEAFLVNRLVWSNKFLTSNEQIFDARLDLPCFLLTWRDGTFPLTGLVVWWDTYFRQVICFWNSCLDSEAKCNGSDLFLQVRHWKIKHRSQNAQHYPWEAKQDVMATEPNSLVYYTTMLQNLIKKLY